MTEVTEVTSEQPAAAAEGEAKPEEGKKEGEDEPKEKPKEEEKKKEPKPKVEKPAPDYRTVKAGWIEKPGKDLSLSLSLIHTLIVCAGVIFKSFKRLYMTLDEDGSVLRWWKTEQRTGSDGALYMK